MAGKEPTLIRDYAWEHREPLFDAMMSLVFVRFPALPERIWRIVSMSTDPEDVPAGVVRFEFAEVTQLVLGDDAREIVTIEMSQ